MVAPLALVINVEELTPVAVDVGVEKAEPPEQGARRFGVAWVEFTHLGVEQVGEDEGAVFGVTVSVGEGQYGRNESAHLFREIEPNKCDALSVDVLSSRVAM